MSYDPFAQGPDVPPPEYDSPQLPGAASYAQQRVQVPAIALIVVGIVNLILMLFQVGATVRTALRTPQDIQKEAEENLEKMEQLFPGLQEAYKQQMKNESPEGLKTQALITNTILSVLGLLAAFLSLFGGIRMRGLRSYALSVAGAISAAIPCLTCSGTCCFGEVIGLWALIVLLNAEVRAAFV
jgi:hypothetical protein